MDFKILPIPEMSNNFTLPKVDFHNLIKKKEKKKSLILLDYIIFLLNIVICEKKNYNASWLDQ